MQRTRLQRTSYPQSLVRAADAGRKAAAARSLDRCFDWDEKSILLISLFEAGPAREREPESGTYTQFALDRDLSAVGFYDLLHDG